MQAVAGFPKREAQAIGLIGLAHLLSHLYMLPLAPLLLAIQGDIGISKAEFGLAIAAFAVTTGAFQTPMGLLVERVGGRAVLIGGLFSNAICFVLIGLFATDFWSLAGLLALAGIGNSVFHPADYSLLSSSVESGRIGRAFSFHTLSGHIGILIGPVVTAGLEPFLGWRGAVVAIGVIGVVMALVLVALSGAIAEGNQVRKKAAVGESLRDLATSPPVLLFFAFYVFSAAANVGITQFSVAAFQEMYGLDRVTAVVALTTYQIAALLLVLPGGFLADKAVRMDVLLIVGVGASGLLVLVAGTGALPFWLCVGLLAVAGAMRGGVNAARDVSVRHVSSHLPVGTVFGFITTGFLVGQATAGPLFGWLYDNFSPQVVFYTSAVASFLAVVTILLNPGSRRQPAAAE